MLTGIGADLNWTPETPKPEVIRGLAKRSVEVWRSRKLATPEPQMTPQDIPLGDMARLAVVYATERRF